MDEAQEKIAETLRRFKNTSFYPYSSSLIEANAKQILIDLVALGYRKPPICQKCGSPILLSQNISGLRANCGCSGTPIDFPIDNRWAKPKDKPPLLGGNLFNPAAIVVRDRNNKPISHYDAYEEGKQAQREADIKHYEG